jgi:hypothetical protein
MTNTEYPGQETPNRIEGEQVSVWVVLAKGPSGLAYVAAYDTAEEAEAKRRADCVVLETRIADFLVPAIVGKATRAKTPVQQI